MRIHVIVNPKAGRKVVQHNLPAIMGSLLIEGLASQICITQTQKQHDATTTAASLTRADTDLIIACGGDGTLNEIANGLMCSGSGIPIAVLAAGTSNDFATSLRLPDDPFSFCQMVKDGHYRDIDLGLADDKHYLVNVAAFGIFTDVSHKTQRMAKNTLGRLAYYLQAMITAPEQVVKTVHLDVDTDNESFSGDYQLCIIANSTSVGTFRKLMHKADVSDGLFDVLLLKKKSILAFGAEELATRITSGELFQSSAVKYLQTSKLLLNAKSAADIEVDIDGEYYGLLPLKIEVVPRALQLLVPMEGSHY